MDKTSETILSSTQRFRAEVVETQISGKYTAHYFGPEGSDRGVKDHAGNWLGVKDAVERLLEKLEIANPPAEPGTQI